MNQGDLARIEEEMLSGADTPEARQLERDWIVEQLQLLCREQARTRAGFRLNRFLRDDDRMSKLYADWKKIGEAIGFLEARHKELGEQ